MTAEEMDNMFDVLYNNITSTQAPGLNAYEKSIFLTKAQDEIVKNYFNSRSKGNSTQEGFDDNPKRQIDFSMITSVYVVVQPIPGTEEEPKVNTLNQTLSEYTTPTVPALTSFEAPVFDTRSNNKSVILPTDIMFSINEVVEVLRNNTTTILQVIPIKFSEYSRLMIKPFKRPLKYQAWRLINSNSARRVDIIVGPSDTITKYTLRYVRRPQPIIVSDLDGLKIEGKESSSDCELDPIIHEDIVQRAVELAKIAWAAVTIEGTQLFTQAGQRSE